MISPRETLTPYQGNISGSANCVNSIISLGLCYSPQIDECKLNSLYGGSLYLYLNPVTTDRCLILYFHVGSSYYRYSELRHFCIATDTTRDLLSSSNQFTNKHQSYNPREVTDTLGGEPRQDGHHVSHVFSAEDQKPTSNAHEPPYLEE